MKEIVLSLTFLVGTTFSSIAQNVIIPDANFKAYLVSQSGINLNMDTEIQLSEASVYNGAINLNSLNILDLTGIEAFTAMTGLLICYNPITSMDLSQNTNLTSLECYINQLTSLDVSANTSLTTLRFERNMITSIDLSNLSNLTMLTCGNNELSSLDVSNNPMLDLLDFGNSWATGGSNQISSIDLSNNTLLTTLGTTSNPISALDLSNNTNLEMLYCDRNSLTSLNVSMLPNLNYLSCSDNALTALNVTNNLALTDLYFGTNPITGSIDVSNLPSLKGIECMSTSISSLNIANGNNTNFSIMWAISNPNLTCVQVDDAVWSAANWNAWNNIDPTASYSEDCNGGLGLTSNVLKTMKLYPNPSTSNLTIETDEVILQVSIFNFDGKLVQNENSASFSVESLATGIYNVNVVTNNGVKTIRFTKE